MSMTDFTGDTGDITKDSRIMDKFVDEVEHAQGDGLKSCEVNKWSMFKLSEIFSYRMQTGRERISMCP